MLSESGVPTGKNGKGDPYSYERLVMVRKENGTNNYCILIISWELLWFL